MSDETFEAEETLIEDLGLDEDLSIEIHPDGSEVTLRIIRMDGSYEGQTGKKSIHVTFDDVNNPDTIDDIDIYIGKPGENDTVKGAKRKKKRILEFYEAFGIETSGQINVQGCIGLIGDAILGVDEFEGRRKNTIRSFVTGS